MAYLIEKKFSFDGAESQDAEQQLAKAERLYEKFTGPAPIRFEKEPMAGLVPKVVVDLGALRGVIYTKDHQGRKQTYIHFMEDPPRLLCDPHGKQLYVHGGSYRITRRGIEG